MVSTKPPGLFPSAPSEEGPGSDWLAHSEELKRWERLLEGQVQILAELVGESELHQTLEGICRLIEAFNPEILSSVLLLDPDRKTIRLGAAPNLPLDYWQALDGYTIGPMAGSCGTAMYRAEQVIVTDINTDPLWAPYKGLALPHGLQACWSTPIISAHGLVEGTFAMYFRNPRSPSEDDLKLVNFAARLTGVAIDRIRAHMRLHKAIAELEQARAVAEQASQAKSAFLASMSHELRTPLNAILLFSELLAEDADEDGDVEAAGDIRHIQTAGNHLLSLINGILDLSKIEAGAMDVLAEDVDLEALLLELAGTLRPMVEGKGNRLELELDPGLKTIRTDFTKLRQILYNLVGNSSKFTEGGVITLGARRMGNEAHFLVRDSGIGMNPEQLGRLFHDFIQAEVGTSRKYGGTGLGLTISKKLCELLGGRIAVESEPGVGTVFTVALPLSS